MRTKNAKPISACQSEHLARVKSVACVLCDRQPPVSAHHPIQGLHWVAVAVCGHCHQGPGGIHGDGTMLRLRYGTNDLRAQLRAVNETLARVAALEEA